MYLKRNASWFFILLCFFCFGCPPPSALIVPSGGGQPVQVQGTYIHPGVGVAFPVQFGALQRESIQKYGGSDYDISVGYNLLSYREPIVLTMYIYPMNPEGITSSTEQIKIIQDDHEKIIQKQFNGVLMAIALNRQGAKLLKNEDYTLSQAGQTLTGRKAILQYKGQFAAQEMEIKTVAYLFMKDGWFYKYRATCPADVFDMAEETIDHFVNNFPVVTTKNRD